MKYLPLVWKFLFRRKARTMLTLLSIACAFLLFGLLEVVRLSFVQAGRSAEGAARLQTNSKLSFIQTLPLALEPRIAGIDGVLAVSHANWFGGVYRDPRNQIFSFAVAPNYLELYPEIGLGEVQRRAFAATAAGALVGQALADRFAWKVGDQIPLQSTIYADHRGSKDWRFEIVGIMRSTDRAGGAFFDELFLLHWKTFDETTPFNRGRVGWYITRVADPAEADRVARAIDALSANSDHETRTQTEQAAVASWMKQVADIGLIVGSIMSAVFFTLLLLAGSTMMQAVRERDRELAVLKAIGYSNGILIALLLAEALLLLVLGGCIGLVLASLLAPGLGAASGGVLILPPLSASTWAAGLAIAVATGALVGALPAWRAFRRPIVAALAGR